MLSKLPTEIQEKIQHYFYELNVSEKKQHFKKVHHELLYGWWYTEHPNKVYHIENQYCTYKNVVFGKHVQISTISCDGIQQNIIELDRMKYIHCLIVVKLSELESLFPKWLIIIPSVPVPKKTQKTDGNMALVMR